jgi:pimeloyl-ACP methyl ester carboxylesterase
MVLNHGMTTYSFIWRNLIPGFAEEFDVIAVDLLGCRDSDKPADADYSISAQAEMVCRLIERIGIAEAHFVTHDIGGGIGQIIAVRYPDMVRSLVLINSVAYDFWPVQPIITMRIPVLRQLAMAVMDIGIFKILIRRGVYHKERVDDSLMKMFFRPIKTVKGRQGFLQLARSLNNRQLVEIAADIRNLSIPVMIIRGDADPYLGARISEKPSEEIKGSVYKVIPTGGHFVMEDEPDLLVDMIKKFIATSKT